MLLGILRAERSLVVALVIALASYHRRGGMNWYVYRHHFHRLGMVVKSNWDDPTLIPTVGNEVPLGVDQARRLRGSRLGEVRQFDESPIETKRQMVFPGQSMCTEVFRNTNAEGFKV